MLNIQPLVIKSPLHPSSSLECVKGKVYNEKMQFVQMIIHDINRIGTSIVEFLHKSRIFWRANAQIGLGVTSVEQMFIEE